MCIIYENKISHFYKKKKITLMSSNKKWSIKELALLFKCVEEHTNNFTVIKPNLAHNVSKYYNLLRTSKDMPYRSIMAVDNKLNLPPNLTFLNHFSQLNASLKGKNTPSECLIKIANEIFQSDDKECVTLLKMKIAYFRLRIRYITPKQFKLVKDLDLNIEEFADETNDSDSDDQEEEQAEKEGEQNDESEDEGEDDSEEEQTSDYEEHYTHGRLLSKRHKSDEQSDRVCIRFGNENQAEAFLLFKAQFLLQKPKEDLTKAEKFILDFYFEWMEEKTANCYHIPIHVKTIIVYDPDNIIDGLKALNGKNILTPADIFTYIQEQQQQQSDTDLAFDEENFYLASK